jgi:hypothetical protein
MKLRPIFTGDPDEVMQSWIAESDIKLDPGEIAHWRTLAWCWRAPGWINGELLVTNERVAFGELRSPPRLVRLLAMSRSGGGFSIGLEQLEGTSVGSFFGSVASNMGGNRRLRFHLTNGGHTDAFTMNAELTAEIVESALSEWLLAAQ